MRHSSVDLAQIRAKPMINYCAWNEPNVALAPAAAAATARWFRRIWPATGVLLAAFAALSYLG